MRHSVCSSLQNPPSTTPRATPKSSLAPLAPLLVSTLRSKVHGPLVEHDCHSPRPHSIWGPSHLLPSEVHTRRPIRRIHAPTQPDSPPTISISIAQPSPAPSFLSRDWPKEGTRHGSSLAVRRRRRQYAAPALFKIPLAVLYCWLQPKQRTYAQLLQPAPPTVTALRIYEAVHASTRARFRSHVVGATNVWRRKFPVDRHAFRPACRHVDGPLDVILQHPRPAQRKFS